MKVLTKKAFDALCYDSNNTLLKTTYNRPKLLEDPQGHMIKIFYPRHKRFSSNLNDPYALRFCRNATKLDQLGITTPRIVETAYCPELKTYVITYQKVSGTDVRVLAEKNHDVIKDVAAYLADLHQRGIFFRSIHLENILQRPDHSFALIDIVDVTIKKHPLSTYLRLRNLKHLFQTKDDQPFWSKYGIKAFLTDYIAHANLSWFAKTMLSSLRLLQK